MRRLLKPFWIWILVLAMPVQALAASQWMPCGPGHAHAAMSAAAGQSAGPLTLAQPMDALGVHQGHTQSTPSDGADMSQHQCSACAACCSALALPSHVPALDTSRMASAAQPALVSVAFVYITGGPDRPPRRSTV